MQQDASIRARIDQVIILRQPLKDWYLSANQVDVFLHPSLQSLNWTDWIWHAFVSPSSSYVAWRCLHNNKMSTDKNLMKLGCIIVSVCDLCMSYLESKSHLFLYYQFATQLWQWLGSLICIVFDTSCFQSLFESFAAN
jgi:hypothetical protein